MSNPFSFTVPGEPVGKESPRTVNQNGVIRTYIPEKTVVYMQAVQYLYRQANGPDFGNKPIAVTIRAFFPVPKSASKSKREDMLNDVIKPTITPDADNIQKAICDALNGVAYTDDRQVVSSSIVKMYAAYPCVHVELEEAVYEA